MSAPRALGAELRAPLARSPQAGLPMVRGLLPGQENLFPPAAHLLNAEDDKARCRIVLQLPDALVVSHGLHMERACREAGFALGTQFLAVRQAALSARRDTNGALPKALSEQLAFWRQFMAAQARLNDTGDTQ